MPDARAGLLGFDILRRYVESNKRRVALLGAFRGKAIKSEFRFAGGGSFSGPYFGIDQPTDKLTCVLRATNVRSRMAATSLSPRLAASSRFHALDSPPENALFDPRSSLITYVYVPSRRLDLFRLALLELYISMPLEESEAIFRSMADENGMVGIVDLMRECRAEPCDSSARFNRQRYGQQFAPSKAPVRTERVAPTRSSAYTRDPPWVPRPQHRPAPQMPVTERAHRKPPPPPPQADPTKGLPHPEATRDKRGQFHNGANVLSSNVSFGSDESVPAARRPTAADEAASLAGSSSSAKAAGSLLKGEAAKHRRAPPPPPPNIMYPRKVPSAFVHDQPLQPVDVSDDLSREIDADRWTTTARSAAQPAPHRRAPPKLRAGQELGSGLGSGDPRSLNRPSSSGFTHGASIFISGERPPPPLDTSKQQQPPPPQGGPRLAPPNPWVSGYNRSERMGVGRPDMKEAWADGGDPYQLSGIPHEPPPDPKPQPDAIIMPSRTSGFTMECSICASERSRGGGGGQCVFCRMSAR